MSILKNEMHERFCNNIMNGYTNGGAYIRAQVVEPNNDLIDAPKVALNVGVARTYAWRLLQKDYIKKRISELKQARWKRYKRGEAAIEKKLFEAMHDESVSIPNQLRATEAYMKFLGKGVENHNHTHQGSITINNSFGDKQ
jgi:hypothetical protein